MAGGAPASAAGALRRPSVRAALALALLGAVGLGGWLYHRAQRAAWAREVALPEIEKLLDASAWTGGPGIWQAYRLGREAERILPGDPLLQRLEERYSRPVSFYSDPPGARVSARPYGGTEADWEVLGETPVEKRRFVQGVVEVRVEKAGFEPVDDVLWSSRLPEHGPRLPLAAGGVESRGNELGFGHGADSPASTRRRPGSTFRGSRICRRRRSAISSSTATK